MEATGRKKEKRKEGEAKEKKILYINTGVKPHLLV